MSIISATFEKYGRPPVKLDLATQRLLIQPDDPLPKFYPRPKAVMVVPIYDDSEIGTALTGPTVVTGNGHSSYAYVLPGKHDRPEVDAHGQRPPSPDRHEEDDRGRSRHRPHRRRHDSSTKHRLEPTDDSWSAAAYYSGKYHTQESSQQHSGSHSHSNQHHGYNDAHPGHSGYRPPGASPGRTPPENAFQRLKIRNDEFQEAIRNYFKILPPNPKFCRSCCSGRKKAVCIGINYIRQKNELKGCANDARAMAQFLIQEHHFPPSDVIVMTDDDRNNTNPTREEMFRAMRWLVDGAQKDDSLFFHYSGHGGQVKDETGREIDGMDEDIFPVDHAKSGDIIDDELYKELVEPLPPGCRLTALFDSCHSGTVLDLPYIHSAHGRLRGISHISKRARTRGVAPSADVICFSACTDDEKAADTFSGNVAVGAMSHAFIECLENHPSQTYDELLARLREILIPRYHQKAQISCTIPLDLEKDFTL